MAGYTVIHTDESPDVLGDYPGEMRLLTRQLDSEQVAITYRRLPPGTGHLRGRTAGHRHRTQEEVYFLVSGRVLMKLDEDVLELEPGTAVRIAPEVGRTMRNEGDEDAVVLLVSTHEVDPREDAEVLREFWPE